MLILFIDDDYEDYEMFCEATKVVSSGIKCLFKHNGAEGLLYLQHADDLPDYIVLDLHMPVMDGSECLKQIRLNARLKHIPIIIFSTDIDPTKIAYYRNLGANDFITKPSSFPALVQTLTDVIERSPGPSMPPSVL